MSHEMQPPVDSVGDFAWNALGIACECDMETAQKRIARRYRCALQEHFDAILQVLDDTCCCVGPVCHARRARIAIDEYVCRALRKSA